MLYLLNVVTESLRARFTRSDHTVSPGNAGPASLTFVHWPDVVVPAYYTDGRMKPVRPGV